MVKVINQFIIKKNKDLVKFIKYEIKISKDVIVSSIKVDSEDQILLNNILREYYKKIKNIKDYNSADNLNYSLILLKLDSKINIISNFKIEQSNNFYLIPFDDRKNIFNIINEESIEKHLPNIFKIQGVIFSKVSMERIINLLSSLFNFYMINSGNYLVSKLYQSIFNNNINIVAFDFISQKEKYIIKSGKIINYLSPCIIKRSIVSLQIEKNEIQPCLFGRIINSKKNNIKETSLNVLDIINPQIDIITGNFNCQLICYENNSKSIVKIFFSKNIISFINSIYNYKDYYYYEGELYD